MMQEVICSSTEFLIAVKYFQSIIIGLVNELLSDFDGFFFVVPNYFKHEWVDTPSNLILILIS
jgi:hypothetical protein